MTRVQNPQRPISGWQVCFSQGANVGSYPQTWYDITAAVLEWTIKYGKQRELGIAESGIATILVDDPNENFNPQNTSSPYNTGSNALKLYRPVRHWEMCTSYTRAAGFSYAGNMLNSAVTLPDGTSVNDTWGKLAGNTGTYADSSTFEGGTTGNWSTNGTGATIANSTAQAHDGTHSMLVTWPTQTGGGLSNAAIVLTGMPLRTGDTYTVSAWVYIVSGPAVMLYCNGNQTLSSTTTGVWQRVQLTFQAQDGNPTHIWLFASGTTTAGQQVYVDSVQLEWASSASAFTTTGPTIYPVFTGFLERYPNTWNYAGFRGQAKMTAVDALGMIPRVNFDYSYYMDVEADSPAYWWPMDDDSIETTSSGYFVVRQLGTNDPTMAIFVDSTASASYGASSIESSGNRLGIGADQLSYFVVTPVWSTGTSPPTTPSLGAAATLTVSGSKLGGSAAGWSCEFWFNPTATGWTQRVFTFRGTPSAADQVDEHQFIFNATSYLYYRCYNSSSSMVEQIYYPTALATGQWYHVAFTTSSNGTTITSNLYLNGALVGTATRSGTTIPTRNQIIFGSGANGSGGVQILSGTGYYPYDGGICNVALYQGQTLSAARILYHYNSGSTGWTGDTVGQRLQRLLAWAFWNGIGYNISASAGVIVGPAWGLHDKSCSDAIKQMGDTDQGLIYADVSGRLTYIPQTTIAALTPYMTFGENSARGEVPYRIGITSELEPSQVYNDITITVPDQPNPNANILDLEVLNNTSIQNYGTRSLTVEVNFPPTGTGNSEMAALGAFMLNEHKDPLPIATNIVVPLAGYPAAWLAILLLRIGQCVTFKRRTIAFTESINGYIQSVAWSESPTKGADVTIDIEPKQI